MGEDRSAFKLLTYTPTGETPLGSYSRRWEENIRMDLKEIGISTRNWVDSTKVSNYWRTFVNAVLNLRVPIMGLVS